MLACERHGCGEPLVLVHGVAHRRQAWYPVLDLLSEHREVILVDLPGHGQSSELVTHGRPVGDVVCELFEQFLQEQGLDRPHIGGNSLGGRIALEVGASGHARSVTALSPAGFWGGRSGFAHTRRQFTSAASIIERLGSRAERVANTRAGRRLIYGLLMAHPGRVSSDHALGDIRAFAYASPALRLLLDAATPFGAAIPSHVPITIAWAARDLVLPPWQADVARALLPEANHVMMRGVGHVPMWDNPKHVARVLLRGSSPVAEVAALSPVATSRQRARRSATAASA